MIPKQYKEYYKKLSSYLLDNYNVGIIEQPNAEDAWYPSLNLIYINKNLRYRERLFCLLHEAGHAIIDNNIRYQNITCFNKNSPQKIKSKVSYIHTLNEEILAWNYGRQLVKELDLKIEENKFEEYMTDCVMSYIREGLLSLYGKTVNVNSIRRKFV